MANIGDILKVTYFGSYLGQQVLNVFFWEIGNSSTGDMLLFSFGDELATQFQQLVVEGLSNNLSYDRCVIDNLTDGLEFTDFAINLGGLQPGEPMPSSVALGVKLLRSSKITRNGSKRFAGMVETQVNGNQNLIVNPGKGEIEEFCGIERFITDYDGQGNDIYLNPVIVGRTKDGSGVYQLDLSKINFISSASMSPTVSTQNSRKP